MSSTILFDLTGWTWFRVAGRDAHKFLHNFCTNDIQKLPQTHGCEAFVTNVKARVLGHVFAFEASNEVTGPAIDVFSFPGQEAPLLAHLDRYLIREEVTLEGRSDATATFLLSGTERLSEAESTNFGPYQQVVTSVAGQSVLCHRFDLLGEHGQLVTCDRSIANEVRTLLTETGTFGSETDFEPRRIAAALPIYGVDVTEDQLAPEVGRPWAISYTKGCYLGQEPIARIDALGHVNRLLRRLSFSAEFTPAVGTPLVADDKEIGTITSAAPGVAMGYVRSKFADAGTTVSLSLGNERLLATVTAAKPPSSSN